MLSKQKLDNYQNSSEGNLHIELSTELLAEIEKSYSTNEDDDSIAEKWIQQTNFEETAIENSLSDDQKVLEERFLKNETLYDDIIDKNQLT